MKTHPDQLFNYFHSTNIRPTAEEKRKLCELVDYLHENGFSLLHGENHIKISINGEEVATTFLIV